MNGIDIAGWLLALPVVILFLIYCLELLVGLPPSRPSHSGVAPLFALPKATILIPAHDEGAGMRAMLELLLERVPAGFRILVVADNCSDDTAAIARACGAQVLERNDPLHRGKGYALAYGRDHLVSDPPAVVLVLDADCTPARGTIERLASIACNTQRPIQATYLLDAPADAPPLVQISNFAFLVKNLFRQRGLARMGDLAVLTGTGMAFPWKIFAAAPLSTGDIVEDLGLSVWLTREGMKPRFCEEAEVRSGSAAQDDTITQRTRWEHGFIATARRYAPSLLARGLANLSIGQVLLGLHIMVPPLALLFVLGTADCLLLVAIVILGGSLAPLLLALAMMATAVALTLTAWLTDRRRTLSLSALIRIPGYILWKIPVYLKLIKGPETRWVKTPRSVDNGTDP